MKRIIAILILSAYLVSNTEFHEFFKLPVLTQHFLEHKEANSSLTFIDFLHNHYSGTQDSDHHHKDMELPFKSHPECSHVATVVALIPSFENFNDAPRLFFSEQTLNFEINTSVKSSYLSFIWQPPKVC